MGGVKLNPSVLPSANEFAALQGATFTKGSSMQQAEEKAKKNIEGKEKLSSLQNSNMGVLFEKMKINQEKIVWQVVQLLH